MDVFHCLWSDIFISEARWPGGYSVGAPPDSIPNSAVKIYSADGTLS